VEGGALDGDTGPKKIDKEREERKSRTEGGYIQVGRGLRENFETMYTHGQVHVQAEISRNGRSKTRNERLELDVQSIYNWISESNRYRRQEDEFVGPMYLTFSNIR